METIALNNGSNDFHVKGVRVNITQVPGRQKMLLMVTIVGH